MYSIALGIKRICSLEKDFKRHIEELKGWFKAREYPESVTKQELDKVMQKPLLDQPKSKDCGVPSLVTYNPHLATLCRTIHKHF